MDLVCCSTNASTSAFSSEFNQILHDCVDAFSISNVSTARCRFLERLREEDASMLNHLVSHDKDPSSHRQPRNCNAHATPFHVVV